MVNGSMRVEKRQMPPSACPFCDDEPIMLSLPPSQTEPMMFAFGCQACQFTGPPGTSEALALFAWNKRAGEPSTFVTAGTDPLTCQAAAVLVLLARKLYSNELGPMHAFLLMLADPTVFPARFGMHVHALDLPNAIALCQKTLKQLSNKPEPKSPGGIILPGRV